MEGNKRFLINWYERYNIEVFKLAINKDIPIIDINSKFLEIKNYSNLQGLKTFTRTISRKDWFHKTNNI